MPNEEEKFPGFPPEIRKNFWCYPRMLDGYLYLLTGAERDVLRFILRRTWGYMRYVDKISLSQFQHGVGKHDKGTGFSRKHIITCTENLERLGFINIQRGGWINEYSLVKSEHQEQQSTGIPSSTGREKSLLTSGKIGLQGIHTIQNLSIENTIEKIYDHFSFKIFPGASESSSKEKPRLTKKALQKITERLIDYTPEQLRTAINRFADDEWQMRNNGTRGIAWFFDSEDRVEQFLNLGKLDDYQT